MRLIKKYLLILCLPLAINTSAMAGDDFLIGGWSIDLKDCKRPEFIFEKNKVTVQGDADGTPTSKKYKKIQYLSNDNVITVKLFELHGYAKTRNKQELDFEKLDENKIFLKRELYTDGIYNRCPGFSK